MGVRICTCACVCMKEIYRKRRYINTAIEFFLLRRIRNGNVNDVKLKTQITNNRKLFLLQIDLFYARNDVFTIQLNFI